jgi:Na+-driven multidrug efflux pump
MLTVSITCAVLVIASPQAVVQMILPGRALASSEILDLRVFMSVVAFLPIAFLGITYFPAIGIGSLPALLALARQVLVFIPVAVVATRFLGISGVYRAFFWTDAVFTLVAGFLLIRHMSSLGRHAGGVETGPEAPQGHL